MVTLVRYMDKDLLKQLPQCEGGEEDLCDIDPSKLLLEHVSRYCYHHDHQLNNSMFIIIHSVQFGPQFSSDLSSVRTSKESTTPEVASEASFRVKLLGK